MEVVVVAVVDPEQKLWKADEIGERREPGPTLPITTAIALISANAMNTSAAIDVPASTRTGAKSAPTMPIPAI